MIKIVKDCFFYEYQRVMNDFELQVQILLSHFEINSSKNTVWKIANKKMTHKKGVHYMTQKIFVDSIRLDFLTV
jgi:hypothetical protein